MNVYAETNFLLETVYQQEQSASCARILDLALSDRIRLRIPAFSVAEAVQAVNARKQKREKLLDEIDQELRELRRSSAPVQTTDALERVRSGLARTMEEEGRRLSLLRPKIHSLTIPLDQVALDWSELFRIMGLFKQVGDTIVFASIVADVDQRRSRGEEEWAVFLTRDKGFARKTDWLDRLNLTLFTSFDNGWQHIQAQLGHPADAPPDAQTP